MHYLTFKLAEHLFAIDSQYIAFISPAVAVTTLPMVADYIDGVVNIEGQVLAQICLAKLFAIDDASSASQLIVIDIHGHRIVLSVDTVLDRVEVQDGQCASEQNNDSDVAIAGEYFEQEVYIEGENFLAINVHFLKDLVKPVNNISMATGFLAEERTDKSCETVEQSHSYLRFCMGHESYIIPLLEVMEVVEVDTINVVPGSHAEIKGITNLRDQPLLILDGHRLFNSAAPLCVESNQVFILSRGQKRVGFLVDKICGIINYTVSELKHQLQKESILGAYIVDKNHGINLQINTQYLFSQTCFTGIDKFIPAYIDESEKETVITRKLLQVAMNDQSYVIPLENVICIAEKEHENTMDSPEQYLTGTVSIEGEILPLIDLSDYLGSQSDHNSASRSQLHTNKIVIIDVQRRRWAMNISSAQCLLDVDIKSIELNRSHNYFILGIANIDNTLLSILDFSYLHQQTAIQDVS